MTRSIRPGMIALCSILAFSSLPCTVIKSVAQGNIPVGSWRFHLSYNDIRHVEVANNKIFAASRNGILVYDLIEHGLSSYNKLNGLNSTAISSIAYDTENDLLLVGYETGALDIIKDQTVIEFKRLRDAEITDSKEIHHISVWKGLAYLSTEYGVVVFDLTQNEIKETWRDLGSGGERLPVYETTFLNDTIFMATSNGVLAGTLSENLLDYSQWRRFNTGELAGRRSSVVSFNGAVYASGASGFFRRTGDTWVKQPFLEASAITSMSASSEKLLLISDGKIWSYDNEGFTQVADALIVTPAAVAVDDAGALWIGDQQTGLISNQTGSFSAYVPNGPSLRNPARIVYDDRKIFVVGGGLSASGQALHNPGDLNVFENGTWSSTGQPAGDLTDIAFLENKTFISSFGSGIIMIDESGNKTSFDQTNSPLINSPGDASNVTALSASADGLWVANYGGDRPLHLLKADGTWESFSFGVPNAGRPIELLVDWNENVWILLDPNFGGGIFVYGPGDNRTDVKTNALGAGALPDNNILSIALDHDGFVWVGTKAGVAYFFSSTQDAIKPIFESRFLLRDEKVTAIEVDAGNRKWIGTEAGLWLFDAAGESLIHHFTSENSPLLSDVIRDIEINSETGELFISTDEGIISYRSDAISADVGFGSVRIFPNPVNPGYQGAVAISGLANNAIVRITDVSGKLIWQTQANGGMATWNVRNHDGRRPSTGIYLIFATTVDGTESMVGKLAVIE